jgi:hypothetical protein
MVLLSAQGMPVTKIAEVIFISPDRVRDVIHDFNAGSRRGRSRARDRARNDRQPGACRKSASHPLSGTHVASRLLERIPAGFRSPTTGTDEVFRFLGSETAGERGEERRAKRTGMIGSAMTAARR